MKSNIQVITNNSCNIYIKDTSQYLSEDMVSTRTNFRFSDTISLYAIRNEKTGVYEKIIFSEHTSDDYTQIPIRMDGTFTIIHIILPTKKWIYETSVDLLVGNFNVYYSDGESVFQHFSDKNDQKLDIESFLDINLEALNCSAFKYEEKYISICFLRRCYLDLCKQIFESRAFSSCWSKSNINSELIYRRDLIWMAINVIKYLAEIEQFEEIDRIISIISGCNGLCGHYTKSQSGCGCSK